MQLQCVWHSGWLDQVEPKTQVLIGGVGKRGDGLIVGNVGQRITNGEWVRARECNVVCNEKQQTTFLTYWYSYFDFYFAWLRCMAVWPYRHPPPKLQVHFLPPHKALAAGCTPSSVADGERLGYCVIPEHGRPVFPTALSPHSPSSPSSCLDIPPLAVLLSYNRFTRGPPPFQFRPDRKQQPSSGNKSDGNKSQEWSETPFLSRFPFLPSCVIRRLVFGLAVVPVIRIKAFLWG